jgi:hypothetical protein
LAAARTRSRHVVLTLALGAAGVAGAGLGPGCAQSGHHSIYVGDDDGGDAAVALDAGAAVTAPLPINTGLITDKALCKPGSPSVAWSPVRRISRVEYDNMVRDLLGDTTQPATGFVPESPMAHGVNFDTNTYTTPSILIAQQYQQAAETLADTAVSSASTLSRILPCTTQDDACAQQFIASFANRAFRGQLDTTESAALLKVYSDVKAQFDFTTGIQAIITAVLESPRFLYVLEFGSGKASGNVVPLSSYEIAGRLAFFLWRSVPDATLMTAAAAGQLATTAQVQAQAVRMLADPKALGALNDFAMQWLELQATPTLGKDSQFAATWNNKNDSRVGTEVQDEALTDFSRLVLADNGALTTLLTSSSSYINPNLATFYSVPAPTGAGILVNDSALAAGQTSFAKADMSSAHRVGIFTSAAVMATQAHTSLPSSVLRGKLVREQLLCDQIPAPPPNVPAPPSMPSDAGTTRSLFEAHEKLANCFPCHQLMDPIGFGFGNFDANGLYQATDANGFTTGQYPAIDASGQIVAESPGEFSATFNGASDLMTKLSAAPQVDQCFAIQELRYALSRVETTADACSAQQAYGAFSSQQFNIQSLLVALVQTDAFRYRTVESAGSACQ